MREALQRQNEPPMCFAARMLGHRPYLFQIEAQPRPRWIRHARIAR